MTAEKNFNIEDVLDNLHDAASRADHEAYMSLFAENAVFIGTALEERWAKDVFSGYVKERFNAGNGWHYELIERNIFVSRNGETAWFDETLKHKLGTARGTGVIVRENDSWLVAQYELHFPFPNSLFVPFLEIIRAISPS